MTSPLIIELKSKNPDLKEAEIEGLLHLLLTHQQLTNNELVRLCGISKAVLREFLATISDLLLQKKDESIALSEEGLEKIRAIKPKSYKWTLMEYSQQEAEDRLEIIRKNHNLEPKREFDQFFATIKTSISKAQLMIDKGLVEHKRIALLGDDDLVSISLVLLGGKFERVDVFDIDKDILSSIETITTELEITNVKTYAYDVRQRVNPEFGHKYDVVMMDPPYTKQGVSLFLNRAIQMLKTPTDFSGPYVFLCYGTGFKAYDRVLDIQDEIQKFQLVIEDKIDRFNRYTGAEIIGSSSDMYILKVTPSSRFVQNVDTDKIYTYEVLKTRKFPYVEHYVFKVFDVTKNLLRSEDTLIDIAEKLCIKHNLKIMNTEVTKFKPFGFTVTVILKNSNLLIHTWPEHNAVHIDLVTCTQIYKSEKLLNTVSELFGTSLVEITKV